MNFPDELKFIENRNAIQKITAAKLTGKTCVISGATSGVGLSAIHRLAEEGAALVLIARNKEKAEALVRELQGITDQPVSFYLADFSLLSDVRAVAKAINKDHPVIDILINSAGMHSTKRILTKEGNEQVFCVNHLAPFLLTNLLVDNLLRSPQARIIQVNSEGHRFSTVHPNDLNWQHHHYTGLRGYGASKTAQLLCVWELADRLSATNVTVNAMHPGDVRTNIGSNNGKLYNWFLHHVTWMVLKDAAISGEALYYLAAAQELKKVSGKFFHLTIEEKPARHATDRALGRLIWEKSIDLTGLSDLQFL